MWHHFLLQKITNLYTLLNFRVLTHWAEVFQYKLTDTFCHVRQNRFIIWRGLFRKKRWLCHPSLTSASFEKDSIWLQKMILLIRYQRCVHKMLSLPFNLNYLMDSIIFIGVNNAFLYYIKLFVIASLVKSSISLL